VGGGTSTKKRQQPTFKEERKSANPAEKEEPFTPGFSGEGGIRTERKGIQLRGHRKESEAPQRGRVEG